MSNTVGIVTFNRCEQLKNCLNALLEQTLLPNNIVVYDNASDDNTAQFLKDTFTLSNCGVFDGCELLTSEQIEPRVTLIRSDTNGGGSRGFHDLCKYFIHNLTDNYIILMDDDGRPDTHLLSELDRYHHDYIGALVLDIRESGQRSFSGQKTDHEFINPFNAVRVSRRAIERVGYPRADFFIYGDEVDFHYRLLTAGFSPKLVRSAIHYHPMERRAIKPILRVWHRSQVSGALRQYCYYRNTFYNIRVHQGWARAIRWYVKSAVGLTLDREFAELANFFRATCESFRTTFDGHKRLLQL